MQELVVQTGKGIAYRADKVFEIMKGKPYKWGGKNTNGFDCSGFVAMCLNNFTQNEQPPSKQM